MSKPTLKQLLDQIEKTFDSEDWHDYEAIPVMLIEMFGDVETFQSAREHLEAALAAYGPCKELPNG